MIDFKSLQCVIEPMDMRRGADGLSTWLQDKLGAAPAAGSAFIFSNRKHTRIKLDIMY